MKFSIIVFNYNGGTRLENCLAALKSVRAPEGAEMERLLVDVDSGSGLAERLKEREPGFRLISMPERLGLTESLNQAARTCTGQYLAFVHFHQVLHPSWLTACYQPLESAGAAGTPACTYSDSATDLTSGRVWEAGDTSGRTEVLHPAQGAMLVEREAFMACGEFDPDYYVAEEEVDLGFRLWQTGRTVLQVSGDLARSSGQGVLGHYGSAEQSYFRLRNRLTTVIKNYELDTIYRLLPTMLVSMFSRVWSETGLDWERFRFDRASGKFAGGEAKVTPEAAAGLLALDDVLVHLDRIRSSRSTIQAARSLSDAEIFARVPHPYETGEADAPGPGAEPFVERFRRLMETLAEEDGRGGAGP